MSSVASASKEFSTYSKDTPTERPGVDGRAGVFVPTDAVDLNSGVIRKGAGIVGYGNPDGTLTVYFEANRFEESSLHKWENKVRKAYDRLVMVAPTVSKAKMNASTMELVGYIDGSGIQLKQPDSVTTWLTISDALDTAPESNVITFGRR
ncbi:hypothetical protein [Pseudoduganella umbonata]|uniref:Uncharacterized protein n=1 Tax=Pseudoduganella umbonata TaxID=864828 RepID=A0A4P8HYK0_9BURK|nr:hypothetical protein [Pseudoduganella umbonata]MBB3223489.1 hypothetical protein [Pseudoduganella umbonata]QCP13624.1 hypothetical protein FCL38_26690 [Pseudoduganella umbonata]